MFFRYGGSDVVDLKEADWVEIGDREGRTLRIAIGHSDHLPIRSVLTAARSEDRGENRRAALTTRPIISSTASKLPSVCPGILNERQTYQAFFDRCSYNVDLPANFFTRESLEQRFGRQLQKKK